MPQPIVTGLDIGSSAIRLIVVEAVRGKREPQILAQVKRESRGLRRGYIVNFEETLSNLREALTEAERQAKVKIRAVTLGIGGITLESKQADGQVSVSTADLEIGETDIERALAAGESNLGNLANQRILHTFPSPSKIDGKKVPGRAIGLKGNKLEVRAFFALCLNQHFKDLVKVVEQAGVSVDEVVAAPLAASLPTLSPRERAAGVVLANIGSQTISLITFEEGQPVALQVLPVGSNEVTNDIALGLRLPLDEAERLKLDPAAALSAKRKLDEIVEARLSDMLELIDSHLRKIGRSGLLPAGIVIVGGGANVPELPALARETLRLPARIFDPAADPRLRQHLPDAAWAVAYGLCLWSLEQEAEVSVVEKAGEWWQRFIRWFKDFWP